MTAPQTPLQFYSNRFSYFSVPLMTGGISYLKITDRYSRGFRRKEKNRRVKVSDGDNGDSNSFSYLPPFSDSHRVIKFLFKKKEIRYVRVTLMCSKWI